MHNDGPPAAPSWGKIVSRGDETTIYRSAGVEVTKITYDGWSVLQVAWEEWSEPLEVMRAVSGIVPSSARLRRPEAERLASNKITYEGVCFVFHQCNYIQWEPLREVQLARVG